LTGAGIVDPVSGVRPIGHRVAGECALSNADELPRPIGFPDGAWLLISSLSR